MTAVLLALFASFSVTTFAHGLRHEQSEDAVKELGRLTSLFFYRPIQRFLFPHNEYDNLLFILTSVQGIVRFAYAVAITNYIATFGFSYFELSVAYLLALLILLFLGGILPRTLGAKTTGVSLPLTAPIVSFLLLLFLPISIPLIKTCQLFPSSLFFASKPGPQERVRQELIDLIQTADVGQTLDDTERDMIASAMSFRSRIAREVMVPRVDMTALPKETSVRDAAKILYDVGYSRVPIYDGSIDNIIGILMYKDILLKYMEGTEKLLDDPVASIIKPTLYTPETKKISHLLQDFKKKQVHMAVVVDEYGGTEGIVTIEDILEEIVGEIEDEYDEDEGLIVSLPHGWIVDAKVSIIDLKEETDIQLPQEGDYDTIGGYIYHRAGTIPEKGFTIDHDIFTLVILKSTERGVEKVKILPKK